MCDCRHDGVANTTCFNLVKGILCFDNVKQISTVHVLQDDVIALSLTVGIMDGCRYKMGNGM